MKWAENHGVSGSIHNLHKNTRGFLFIGLSLDGRIYVIHVLVEDNKYLVELVKVHPSCLILYSLMILKCDLSPTSSLVGENPFQLPINREKAFVFVYLLGKNRVFNNATYKLKDICFSSPFNVETIIKFSFVYFGPLMI